MLARCLVLLCCVGIHFQSSAAGNHFGTGLASIFKAAKEERLGHDQVLFWKEVGKEKQKKIAQDCKGLSPASLVQSQRTSTQYPAVVQNDLVLPTVQNSKQCKDGPLQAVQTALGCGMESTQKAPVTKQISKTREGREEAVGSSLNDCNGATESARGHVDDLCREGPMDHINTSVPIEQAGPHSRGRRNAIATCSKAATATAAHVGTAGRREADRSRKHEAHAFQSSTQDGSQVSGGARCRVSGIAAERGDASVIQEIGSQRYQQAGQTRDTEECSVKEAQESGCGVAKIRTACHDQIPASCSIIPSMQTRTAAGVRGQVKRSGSDERGSGQGVTEASGGFESDRGGRDHAAVICGSTACRDHCLRRGTGPGRDGSGRIGGQCGDHTRLRKEACEKSEFPGIDIAIQGGEQLFEDQEGQHRDSVNMSDAPDESAFEEDVVTWHVGSDDMWYECVPWNSLESADNLCSNDNARRVRFASTVTVEVVHAQEAISLNIPCLSVHGWCRQFWDLRGQACEWSMIKQVAKNVKKVPWLSLVMHEQADNEHLTSFGRAETTEQTGNVNQGCPDEDHDAFNELRDMIAVRIHDNPTISRWHVETWFLSAPAFQVCFRSRRLNMRRDMNEREFQEACRTLWADVLDDHVGLTIYRVQPNPNGVHACLGHVIIVGNNPCTACTMLLKHEGLPMPALRAVMFSRGDTTLEILRIAQIDRPCHRADTACYVCAPNGGADFFDTHDIVEVRQASYMLANIRVIHYSDEGESQQGSDQEDESEEDLVSTTVGSANGELLDEDDEFSFMSELGWVARMPQVFEWHEQLHLDAEDEMDEQDDDIMVHQDHEQDIHMHLQHEIQHTQPNEEMSMAITFGVGIADLGRRDTEYRRGDFEDLQRKVSALWNDHAQFATAEICMVYPQPQLAATPNIVLVVGFDYGEEIDPAWKKVLAIQDSALDFQPRVDPYAARMDEIATENSLVAQLGLHECFPYAIRQCDFTIAGRDLRVEPRQMIVDGALIEVYIGPVPEYAARVRHMIAHSDDFYVQARWHMRSHPHRQQITLRVHAISPRNQPLGHRDLQCTYEDLGGLSWVANMQQLWPYGVEKIVDGAYITKLSHITDEQLVPVYHFVLSYARSLVGVPIVVRQTAKVQQDGSSHQEIWAALVRKDKDDADLPSPRRHPFWFQDSEVIQAQRDGNDLRDSTRSWIAGEVLDISIDFQAKDEMLTWLWNGNRPEKRQRVTEHTNLLQTSIRISKQEDVFQEMCEHLQCLETKEHARDHAEQPVQELEELVKSLLQPTWKGLNYDFEILQNEHPAISYAVESTPIVTEDSGSHFPHLY